MARIRTVKPEVFRHELLFQLEQESGLPIRVAWVGLFTVIDREGRFRWRPKVLKLDVLPFDQIDFEKVLDALHSGGLIQKYSVGEQIYGFVPTWSQHQVINQREAQSIIPAPEEGFPIPPGTPNVLVTHVHAHAVPGNAHGEGKGREKEGITPLGEKKVELQVVPSGGVPAKADTLGKAVSSLIGIYIKAWQTRYETKGRPDIGGKARGILMRLLKDHRPEHLSELLQVYCQMTEPKWFEAKRHDLVTFEQNLNTVSLALDKGCNSTDLNWATIFGVNDGTQRIRSAD